MYSDTQDPPPGPPALAEPPVEVALDPASPLDDKVLDASVEQDQVAFTIADQIEE